MFSSHHCDTKCSQQCACITVCLFLFKDQLASVEKEYSAIPQSEVEGFKQTIAEREREIAELSEELQTLQARLQGVSRCQSEEEEEELHRLMVETLELRAKLVDAEDEKQEGKRRLEATHRQIESFLQLIAELREKKNAASQVVVCVYSATWVLFTFEYLFPKSHNKHGSHKCCKLFET